MQATVTKASPDLKEWTAPDGKVYEIIDFSAKDGAEEQEYYYAVLKDDNPKIRLAPIQPDRKIEFEKTDTQKNGRTKIKNVKELTDSGTYQKPPSEAESPPKRFGNKSPEDIHSMEVMNYCTAFATLYQGIPNEAPKSLLAAFLARGMGLLPVNSYEWTDEEYSKEIAKYVNKDEWTKLSEILGIKKSSEIPMDSREAVLTVLKLKVK